MLKQLQTETKLNCSYIKPPLSEGTFDARVRIFYQGKLINVVTFESVESAVRAVRSVYKKPEHNSDKSYQVEPQLNNFYDQLANDSIEF